ncbi:DEAD/DEAH box helicase [Comamonas sp. J-3]|uniref:DEAD/DEAH box helicase n=1 Tax=Comamonas trifloxystrobinivorans TaxID=3350256 RepID=UPI00372C1407
MSTLKLFEYQEAVLEKLRSGFVAGHRSQMLVAPTGGGKTEMAIALLEACKRKGSRAAMVLDRVVLCDQTSKRLDKYGIDHGVIQAGHWRRRAYEPIQICSAQTLEKRGSFPDLQLLIVDEAHQTRKETAELIKNNPQIRVVGLSATPFTKGLANIYSNVVSSITTSELVKIGRLAPLRVFIAKEIDMEGAKKVAGEWSSDDVEQRGMKITGDVVAEWIKKTNEVFGGPRKTVVFCAGVAHGADLATKFADAGYNFVALSYKDDEEYKQQVLKEFEKPDSSIHGLIATDILTKGFDVPDVMIGVSARPFSKSFSSHVQQMGRVMRCFPGKDFALWLDHSGNYLRFQETWEEVFANGVDSLDEGKDTPRKEKTSAEKEAAKCPVCNALWMGNSDACPSCGHVRVLRNQLQNVAGELVEIADSTKRAEELKKQRDWFAMLKYLANARGHQIGWVFHRFRDKFKVDPKFRDVAPMEPSVELLNWDKSQRIRWAKSPRRAAA